MTVALARRFRVQVSTDNSTWVNLGGVSDLNPQVSATTQSADDYDTNGWGAVEKTAQAWTLTIRALRKITVGYVFDAGQEIARAAHDQFGDSARIYVRWFDRNGGPEAYSGRGLVTYAPAQTGVDDLDAVTITITGDGARSLITNPYSAGTAAAVISAVSPSGQGAAKSVVITGSGFTGATAVTFGGTNATSFSVINDQSISAVIPAGSAGSTNVIVTAPGGASTAYVYTRTT